MNIRDIVGSKTIDLNVDIGEGFPHDADLLKFASSANVCCGVHAGSPELTQETIELCVKNRVRIGIHPGYPDRESMGRKPMPESEQRAYLKSIFEQTSTFMTYRKADYLKPHGGFYNDTGLLLPEGWQNAKRTRELYQPYDAAGAFLAQYPGIQSLQMILRIAKVPLMGLPQTAHAEIAKRAGQEFLTEGFADRAYTDKGQLLPRTEPGAILSDPEQIKAQVLNLAVRVDSICIHGDTPNCLEFAELVFKTLQDNGYGIGQ